MAGSNGRAGVVAGVGTTLLISVMIAGTFHAFALRPAVFQLDSLDVDRTARRTALRIVRQHPLEAVRLNIGRVDLADDECIPDGGLIDVNNSAVSAVGRYLELDVSQEAALEKVGGFTSPSDFELQLDWDPPLFDLVTGRVICLPMLGSSAVHLLRSSSGSASRADGRSSVAPIDHAPFGTHAASYVWALSPLLTEGIAAAPAMVFVAAHPAWGWAALR